MKRTMEDLDKLFERCQAQSVGEDSKTALHDGLADYREREARAAITRVVRYEEWLAAGSVLRDIPTIPSDDDYAKAWEAGKAKRR